MILYCCRLHTTNNGSRLGLSIAFVQHKMGTKVVLHDPTSKSGVHVAPMVLPPLSMMNSLTNLFF